MVDYGDGNALLEAWKTHGDRTRLVATSIIPAGRGQTQGLSTDRSRKDRLTGKVWGGVRR